MNECISSLWNVVEVFIVFLLAYFIGYFHGRDSYINKKKISDLKERLEEESYVVCDRGETIHKLQAEKKEMLEKGFK